MTLQPKPVEKKNESDCFAHKWAVLKRYNWNQAAESAYTEALRRLRPLPAKSFVQELDMAAIQSIREQYYNDDKIAPSQEGFKYLNAKKYVPRSVVRAQILNLDRVPPQRILDLGSGAGYFLWVARRLGHEVQGLDTDDVPAYDAMMKLLEIPRVTWRIESQVALPNLGERFDLITAFQIHFNRTRGASGKTTKWELASWDFFLRDLSTHLQPSGRILLRFNRESANRYIPDEMADFFCAHGGRVRRASVSFDAKTAKLNV